MTPRDRRALQIGGSLVLVTWLLLKAIPWSGTHWRLASGRLEQNRMLLAETRAAVKRLPMMEDSMKVLTHLVAGLGPRLLAGARSDEALDDLKARMTAQAGWNHAALLSLTEAPDSATAGLLRRISTTVVLQGDLRGIAGILRSIARDSVITVVERVKIASLEPFAPNGVPEKLQAELRLSAWYLARASGT